MDIKCANPALAPLYRAQQLAIVCYDDERPEIRSLSRQICSELDEILDFIDSFRRKDTQNVAKSDAEMAQKISQSLIIFFFHDGSPRSKLLAKAALAAVKVLEGHDSSPE